MGEPVIEEAHEREAAGPSAATRSLAGALGLAILTFGLLKLIDPFRGWYEAQISASGLPAFLHPIGIASEVIDGALLLGPWFFPPRHRALQRTCWTVGSIWLIGIMLVAVYVHLQPNVPAAVLPLRIKPPVIPLSMLLMAVWICFSVRRGRRVGER